MILATAEVLAKFPQPVTMKAGQKQYYAKQEEVYLAVQDMCIQKDQFQLWEYNDYELWVHSENAKLPALCIMHCVMHKQHLMCNLL